MKPTDEQLNRAAAEVCGWVPIPEEKDGWTNGTEKRWPRPPDYCTDRNALPELWAVLSNRDLTEMAAGELIVLLGYEDMGWICEHPLKVISVAIRAKLRLHVIAALKALGKWQEDWDDEE